MRNTLHNRNEYSDFLSNALAIHGSITPRVLKQVLWVALYSGLVSLLSYHYPAIKIETGPFEYAGLVLGLILVFRINAGYDRWWEARKIWGDIVNKTRNLAILILNQTSDLSFKSKKELLAICSITPYFIKKHLREDDSLEDIKHLTDQTPFCFKSITSNKTLLISSVLSQKLHQLLKENKVSPFVFLQMEKQREKIIDCQGACERISKTPMPFVMAVKSRRFILIFILLLPFSLVNATIYLSPLITSFVSYALFSLDQIGVELQNPFLKNNLSHHPLMSICNKIEQDLKELLEHSTDPKVPFKIF